MTDDLRPPYRIAFDNARDPYTARNALGITSLGGLITSVTAPLSVTGGNLTIDLSGYQPLDADLTAIAALTGTNTIYYRSAANTWTAVTIGGNLSFAGGTLNTAVTPAAASDFPAGAWTAWTPTITASSGTITSTTINTARYTRVGKTIIANVDFTITNAGTGSGTLRFSLPVNVSASGGGAIWGQERGILGVLIGSQMSASSTTGGIVRYDGSTIIAINVRPQVIAIYEGV